MSEALKTNGETLESKKTTEWDNLANPNETWEEHLERAQKSKEAYIDGLLEQPLSEIQESIAKDVSGIMEIDSEIEKNKTDSRIKHGFYVAREQHEGVIRGERIQEELEKDLNQRLVKVDDLNSLANINGTGVNSSETDYNGKKITVLNVNLRTYQGEPLNLLTHSIDFKQTDKHQVIGQGTSNTLRVLPNIWLQRNDQAELDVDGYDSRSNVIFTTYSNPENNNSKPVGGDIIYGFDHVEANSILKLSERDGNTALKLNYRLNTPAEEQLNFFDQVENGASKGSYNEVAIRRYDETGKPKLPDYLLVYNGHISEDAKNHAATFKIPIVNLNRQ